MLKSQDLYDERFEELIGRWGFTGVLFRLAGLLKKLHNEGGEESDAFLTAARRVKSCANSVRKVLKGD